MTVTWFYMRTLIYHGNTDITVREISYKGNLINELELEKKPDR